MKPVCLISVVIWFLVLIASGTGVFSQGTEPHIEDVTVRGEHAIFQGSGLYRYDPVAVAREGIVWDAINLIVALPMFAVAIFLSNSDSLRGKLLLGGLLFYFFYMYLMYATMLSFNPLFLVYVAIFALCPVAFAMNMKDIDVSCLPVQVSSRFPRRLFIGFALTMGVALIVLWVGRIIPIMISGKFPPELAGITTLETQALDLGLIVPLALSTAILLWRKSAWGYLLTSVTLTFGLIMFIAIPAWIVVPLVLDGKINLIEAASFAVLSVIGFLLSVMFYKNVSEKAHI